MSELADVTDGLFVRIGFAVREMIYAVACAFYQKQVAVEIARMGKGVSMKKHRRLNIQREDAQLKRSTQELIQLSRKFAPKWNRISNDGRMAIERSTARSLRAANVRVSRTTKRVGEILEWLDRIRQMERAA